MAEEKAVKQDFFGIARHDICDYLVRFDENERTMRRQIAIRMRGAKHHA